MKNTIVKSFILLFLTLILSCHHNRLKTDQKELSLEILLQEKEKTTAEKVAGEKDLADPLKGPHKGLRINEDRSIDPSHPPVVIDIAGSLKNINEIKLSEIASEIRYVRIETVPDSSFLRTMKFKYYIIHNNIIATNPCGILLYSKDGKYISTIVKN